jgi:hypothetical protein
MHVAAVWPFCWWYARSRHAMTCADMPWPMTCLASRFVACAPLLLLLYFIFQGVPKLPHVFALPFVPAKSQLGRFRKFK